MPNGPDLQLDYLLRILWNPLFIEDPSEAGKVLSFLIKFSSHIATLCQDALHISQLPAEDLIQQWVFLADGVTLSTATRELILRERVSGPTQDIWDITRLFDIYTTAGDRIGSDLLSRRVAQYILELAWEVYEIEQSTDPRVNQIREALEGVAAYIVDVSLMSIGGTPVDRFFPEEPAPDEVVDTYLVPEGTKMTCYICIDQMVTGVTLVACGHSFCEECIFTWINHGEGGTYACPMCRTPIAMCPNPALLSKWR